MKHRQFIYALALLLLPAACTRNEAGEQPRQLIRFNDPVVGTRVKAGAIDGTTYSPSEGPFRVWGYFSDEADVNPASAGKHGVEYISGALCSYSDPYWIPSYTYKDANGTDQTGYYYWRAEAGYLTFHALSPASVASTVEHSWDGGFSLPGYSVEESVAEQRDLLYSDYKCATRGDYNPYTSVDIKFNHALSAVRFRFREYQNYTETIKITKVEVLGAYKTGDFQENRASGALNSYSSAPAWSGQTAETDFTLYNANVASSAALSWDGDPGEAVITDPLGGTLLIVPQVLDHSGEGLGKVSVRVTFTIDDGAHYITVSAALPGLKGRDPSDTVAEVNSWEPGKRYTYVVTIGLNKIVFDPTVEDWTWKPEDDIFVMIG